MVADADRRAGVIPYGIGFALAQLSFQDCVPATDDDLVRTALLICGDCELNAQFDTGISLMIRGLDAYVSNPTGQCGG